MGSQQSPTGDRYLGYSPSARHDRSQHYIHHIDDIAASSLESPQDTSLPSNARHFRGYSAPERERYRYDNDGRLLEQNQKSSPTASPTSSPTQQQQQRPQQYFHQQHQHQHQFHPYHHQQHQPHNTLHHYPPYSHPSMHESIHNNQRGHPMGSHLPSTVGFSIDQPKKEDSRRSPVAQETTTATTTTTTTTAIVSNNGRLLSMHALSSSSSPAAHAYEWEQRASGEVHNNSTHSDPRYHYPIHSHTYPPSTSDNRITNSNSALAQLSPSPSSSPLSTSLSVSSSSSTPSSSSSSPTSTTARLASNHHPTADSASAFTTSTSTAGALPLSTATVPWNRSSLRHEIISMESPPQPASSASFISQHSHHSNPSHGHSHSSSSTSSPPHSSLPPSSPESRQQREGRSFIPTTTTTAAIATGVASSPTSTAALPSQYPSDKVRMDRKTPTPTPTTTVSDPFETDTGSTSLSDSGQQKRRGSSLSTTTIKTATTAMTEEDQEVPRAAAAGATTGRGEQSSIMRSKRATHHASQAAAAGAAGGDDYYDKEEQDNEENQQNDDDQEGKGRDEWGGRGPPPPGSSSSFLSFPSHTTTSSSHGRINNNNNYNNTINSSTQQQQQQQQQQRFRSDQSFHNSSPPLSPSSKRDLRPLSLAQQQHSIDPSSSSSLEHHQKRMMGRPSLSSSSSTSSPPPFAHPSAAAVTPDHPPSSSSSSSQPLTTVPTHGRFSPSMNHTPLSFDQTGHTPSYPPMHSPGGPSLNNKRRSLADLLFVPTKTKAKRNSSSSSASSVDSYRQDENNNSGLQDQLSTANWSNHPKSASATSTTSTSSLGSMSGPAGTTTSSGSVHTQQQQQQQHRMSLESQASPPARKTSTVKGFGKGTGAGGGGLGSSSSPKTFQCTGYPGCNMVFTRSEHLARHERKHTGEKPYKCIVANCPRTFSRYDNMIQHTQTHSDRTKRDSLAAVAAAASAAAAGGGGGGPIGSGPHSRSSSVQSTPLLPGRPRGGSSPVVFGPSWDDHHHRRTTQNNSPASPYSASPAFAHQHHQQQQQQSHHPSHHPIQWSLPSGAPAGSSPALSAQYYSHHHGAESHPYLPGHQGPSTPVVRTLKANSRSLPHLQARASPMALSSSSSTSESPSVGLQQSMSTMEIEELKRRKSEVLLPSSFSGAARAATMSTTTGFGQGIGLGVSPFTPTTSHPQSLPQVEKLTAGEQERLNEHRRSAQAMFFKMNSGREGSMDAARTPEYPDVRPGSQQQYQQPLPQQQQQPLGTSSSTPRSGSTGPALPHVQQLSAQEKDRLLEHRKSTPELMNDMRMKRSSNDPADMVVQPLPSRDSRSGMQWFSQVSTPLTSSPRTSLTPREGSGGSFSVQGHGTNSSSTGHTSGESPVILPPIMGPYEDLQRDRQGRLRSHSSHIHPLSRPSAQFDPSSLAQFSSSEESKDQQRQQFDAALSPRLERHWEDQYFPIRKRHVVEAIERMDSREYLGLKYQVAEHHANEQFRNPEFLGNMTAILCVIRAPQTTWKGGERRQGSQGSVASASEHGGNSLAGSRRTSRDMEVDESDRANMATATKAATPSAVVKTEEGVGNETESMDLDDADSRITSKDVVFQPCRFALDIDVDSFSRDPEPDLRGFESLTINSLFPTRSFVAGFEDTTTVENASEKKDQYVSSQGYPTNARLGRFYLPERSYRTPESLLIQPDSRDQWVCCRFEEYHGVSIWVLESVLDKYHEISRRHKMALTLVGATIHHREAVYSREDWEIHSGERYEVKTKESALYPEMIHQVWRDMYHQHHQRAQQHHHHQQQQYQQQQQHLPSMPQVATYEEYQRSLMQSDPRRDSYQQHSQQAPPPRDRASGPYYSYSDYRQQQQSMHREDLSSAPSSPQSPRHDDFHDETPHHQHQQQQQQQQNQQRQGSTANMHRRISIAELCNPMQSLATERAQRREETASKRTSM